MDKDNINVDLDLKVVEFVTNDTDLKQDDIIDKIKDIVYYACNEEKINAESVSVSIVSGTSGVSVISLWNTLVVIEISISAGVIADVTDVTFCSDSAVTISSAEVTDGTSGSFVIAL